jgi:hypothetical protein
MEYIIAAAFVAVIAYLLYTNKSKLDVNQDGKVDSADAKAVVAEVVKVEEAVVAEVKEVATKVKTAAKKVAAKKTPAKKTAKKQ